MSQCRRGGNLHCRDPKGSFAPVRRNVIIFYVGVLTYSQFGEMDSVEVVSSDLKADLETTLPRNVELNTTFPRSVG
jgi:hypothetical protein